jgi:hypothetical protein
MTTRMLTRRSTALWPARRLPLAAVPLLLAPFLLPLPVGAQAPEARRPGPWSASPLERILERAEALELTGGQEARLSEAVEAWKEGSAEPLAQLEAAREARRRLMELRMDQMAALREILTEDQRQALRREMASERGPRWFRGGRPGPRPDGPRRMRPGRPSQG